MTLPSFKEDHISQIPALQLLQQLGWKYVSPGQAVAARGGKLSSVFLDSVLAEQLAKMNRIDFKGETHPFSESNIHSAVQSLKDVVYDGLVRTNEKIDDLLVLGKSLPQMIAGDTKSFPVQFIDWKPIPRTGYRIASTASAKHMPRALPALVRSRARIERCIRYAVRNVCWS